MFGRGDCGFESHLGGPVLGKPQIREGSHLWGLFEAHGGIRALLPALWKGSSELSLP